ncbi:hypothetical protein [Verticiella sediminum]|uniref:hypothetical protein n=1 Tax=Verticiella sediminum TaxID=1247510 RepID=UPI002482EA97|nr:hypothetical protein [Verticiella sediminum]
MPKLHNDAAARAMHGLDHATPTGERSLTEEVGRIGEGMRPATLVMLTPLAACMHQRAPGSLGRGEITLDAFLAEDHALVSSRGRVPGVVDKPLTALGPTRRVVLTFPHFLVAPAVVVARTDLVMTVPACIAHAYAESHALRLFEPPVDGHRSTSPSPGLRVASPTRRCNGCGSSSRMLRACCGGNVLASADPDTRFLG